MKVLIVIDMQNDFVTGSLGTPKAQAIVPNVKARIESGEFDKIIYTKDTHPINYLDTFEGKRLSVSHCIIGTEGWNIIPELQADGEIIEKPTFGSYELIGALDNYLVGGHEFEEIELCGLCTDICVVSNALMVRAAYPNVPITVRANCCAGVTPELHEAALKVMESCQIDIIR